ncbi:hypothetical protein FA09DRAFT_164485 [Tilletiopsis washingtonensis]|uniref:Uncharacterized protein n=1 Tax=Tilletiopsis washingtonensis TaxID=58919 RepID=A0A316Z452_9BASI|nr:hypothetical protein FA09DRAFT_164485 [Tilletiopsis washingtonensis]PWN94953.1 hypothetical protein FA09DRAFT_164485 [Tilletiopsis washingtonensis]
MRSTRAPLRSTPRRPWRTTTRRACSTCSPPRSTSPPATAADESMEEDEGAEQEAWTESPVTPASTLETFLALHACGLSMLSRATATGSAQTPSLDAALLVINSALSRADELVATCENAAELSDEGEWLVALGDLAQAKRTGAAAEASRRAELAAAAAQSWPSEAEEPALRALETQVLDAATQLLTTEERAETRIQRLCDIGDLAVQLAVIRAQHTSSARAWELASAATKAYLEAVAALQRSGSLGASDASTPTGRARCSLRASLCAASLLRSAGAAPASLTDAQRLTLRDNARVYARQALVDAGLKGATQLDVKSARSAAATHTPLGGWEGMRCTADALLAAVRALWARALLAPATPQPPEEMLALLATAWALLRGTHGEAWRAAFALDDAGPRRITDEGWAVHADEGAFWARWTSAVTRATWDEAVAAAM